MDILDVKPSTISHPPSIDSPFSELNMLSSGMIMTPDLQPTSSSVTSHLDSRSYDDAIMCTSSADYPPNIAISPGSCKSPFCCTSPGFCNFPYHHHHGRRGWVSIRTDCDSVALSCTKLIIVSLLFEINHKGWASYFSLMFTLAVASTDTANCLQRSPYSDTCQTP